MSQIDAPQPPPLPPGLPVPTDDGAAAHLSGRSIPELSLWSTEGREVNLAELAATALVLYVFPKMGRPEEPNPPGWDETPGARGCTNETCAFRDQHEEFAKLGYLVAGLSAQPREEQDEASQRLHLSFPLLADPDRRLAAALELPTFSIAGMTLYKRLTLVARARRIVKVFYPVFPPDESADEVLAWIGSERARDESPVA
jgi:peroxiredoxin